MSGPSRKRSRPRVEDYTIGWICALPIEQTAAIQILDEEYQSEDGFGSSYTLGRIGIHYVVIACLPSGQMGTNSAAVTATKIQHTFPSVRVGLMVGIGGGVPSTESDIRLGDVAVSQPRFNHGGVVQYDFGKTGPNGTQRTGLLNTPPRTLLNAIGILQSRHHRGINNVSRHLSAFNELPSFSYKNAGPDILFENNYHHTGGPTCQDCSRDRLVLRTARTSQDLVIHYGTIASGNQIMKSGVDRDRISSQFDGVLCFEMEAAGLMNSFPCLVVRGICDYADSHKNKKWQPYAAATAAAYAKELLSVLPTAEVVQLPTLISHTRDCQDRTRYPDSASIPTNGDMTNHGRIANVAEVLLESLAFTRMDSRLQNIRTAHTRTCIWLFNQPQYKDWRDRTKITEHHGFLWIKGKPGCGKSTIMKTALARSKKEQPHAITLSYFFNARATDRLEKSSLGMYRSLVHQLLTAIPELQKDFAKHFLRKVDSGKVDEWTIIELQDFISSTIDSLQGQSLNLLIDALDEGEEDDIRDMISFLEELGDASMSNAAPVNICLSSRHYPHISIRNGISLIVENQQGHDQDIIKYVRKKLSGDKGPQHETLMSDICEKASGVFLWVVLVIPMLNALFDQGRESAMRKRLQEIPAKLDGLFAEILDRNPDTRAKSILLLQWVLFSFRPLNPTELYLAVESGTAPPDQMESEPPDQGKINRYILNFSKGLTELSKSNPPTILFIHETIRTFLLQNNGLSRLQPELRLHLVGVSHDQLKRCCIHFFEKDGLPGQGCDASSYKPHALQPEIERRIMRFPFLNYAANFVLKHANAAQAHGVPQRQFLGSFSLRSSGLQRWVRFNNLFEKFEFRHYSTSVTPLHVFSEANLTDLVRLHLELSADVNAEGGRYGSALQAACASGNEEIVRLLVEAGADINMQCGEYDHCFAAAVFKKHTAIVQLLHLKGVSVPQPVLAKCLISAAQSGLTQVITLLLDLGANINCRDTDGKVPLLFALEKGLIEPVELLLDRGASLEDLGDGLLEHSLFQVYRRSQSRILQLFLRRNVNLNVHRMLISAAETNRTTELQLLLDHGTQTYDELEAVLLIAARHGDKDIIQLLLSKGVNVNAFDPNNGNALMLATSGRRTEKLQLLLDNGAHVHAQVGMYGNALQAASKNGNLEAVRLLLSRDAAVNAQGGYFGNALQAAASGGHVNIVQLLLSVGAAVNAQGGYHDTALKAASSQGNLEIVRVLLANGADVNIQGGDYRTALQVASCQGWVAITQLLLENGADVNAQGGWYGTALHAASNKGWANIVQLLLDNGANINAHGGYYGNALRAAHEGYGLGKEDTVQMLLRYGAKEEPGKACYKGKKQ